MASSSSSSALNSGSAGASIHNSHSNRGKRSRSSPSTNSGSSAAPSPPPSKLPRSATQSDGSFLQTFAATNRFRLGFPTHLALTPGGDCLLFLRSSSSTSFVHDLFSLDLRSLTERRLLTAQALLGGAEERLSVEEKAMRERMRISGKGLQSFLLSPADPSLLLLPFAGQLHLFNRTTSDVTQLTHSSSPPLCPQWSPDGSMIAFVRDSDIHVLDVPSSTEWQLTFVPSSSTSTLTNGVADFIAAEEMSRFTGMWWSPDSLHLVYQQTDTTGMERFTIADPSDPASAPTQFAYPRAGKKNASIRVGIVAVDKAKWVGRRSRGGSAASSSASSPAASSPASALTTPTHAPSPPPISVDSPDSGDDALLTSLTESGTGKVVFSPSSHSKRFHYKGSHVTDATIWVTWDRERWPYLVQVVWSHVQCEMTLVVLSRDQREMAILLCETISGVTRELLVEREEERESWINIDQSCMEHLWLEGGQHFVWATERSGQWAVHLHDHKGQLVRKLVHEAHGYRSVVFVDARHDWLYVHASPDPSQQHLLRVPLGLKEEGREAKWLTYAPGVHKATIKRSSWPFCLHQHSSLRQKPVWAVRKLDEGKLEEQQGGAVVQDVAEAMPFESRVSIDTITVPASPMPLYTAVTLPSDLDPSSDRLHPVLVYVYGGPHFQSVTHDYHSYILAHFIASHSFYVVSIDNRGTPFRSRAFERAISRHLATVPVEDQVAGLKEVMRQHPRMDPTRVGVWGWSFGGLMAALLTQLHPSTFHAGIAGAPVTRWDLYDTLYTERYLGLPDEEAEAYRESSPITYADRLRRPLMLIHGTSDDNVYLSHSLQLSDALFREGKEHDFVPLINFTHMVSDPTVVVQLYRTVLRFMEKHVKHRQVEEEEKEEDGEGEKGGGMEDSVQQSAVAPT